MNNEISTTELIKTIADFIEMGHIENIVAMFKQEKEYYQFSGELIKDERFIVRMGMAVLFEQLAEIRKNDLPLAIPSLIPVLNEKTPYMRGDAATLLGIIDTNEALELVRGLLHDSDPQVREIAKDILTD
ncbi:MAG: HEAT repeat domain-containing protein [Proteobacteria bacterium]|nr:HEAT repeat domain-containing protein [Pseudomonadota bacterium]MBU0967398.1 HEAT repeat domain-containing protein [Pseudomonadota bacterium]